MNKFPLAFGLILALTACSSEGTPPPAPVSRALPPKISLDVQSINLADRSGIQPTSSPYNSNHFSPTIDDAIKRWASDRLQAVGQVGQAIVLIKEASLTAQPIPTESGMNAWFKRQQSVKYIGHAEVTVEANGREGFATTDASAMRAVTLPENPTDTEKQDAYYSLLNGLMKDLGQNLDDAIAVHMANFITSSPIFGTTAVPNAPLPDLSSSSSMSEDTSVPTSQIAPAPPTPAPVAAPISAPPRSSAVIPLSGPGM